MVVARPVPAKAQITASPSSRKGRARRPPARITLKEYSAKGSRPASPLRQDPRPLEGIYHATYVSARMHRSLQRLVQSRVLSPDQQAQARKSMENHACAFVSGMETLDQHADFTATGRAIIESARAYMAVG